MVALFHVVDPTDGLTEGGVVGVELPKAETDERGQDSAGEDEVGFHFLFSLNMHWPPSLMHSSSVCL